MPDLVDALTNILDAAHSGVESGLRRILLLIGWVAGACRGVEKRPPDVADVKPDVLWNCVMSKDLDGFAASPREPVLDGGDELGRLPVDVVVGDVGVFHYGRLIKVSSSAVRSMFFDAGGKVSAVFADVDLAAFARNAVHSR